jgi:PAS domain S-box-containing protein
MSGWKSAVWFYPRRTGDPGRDRHARTVQFACLVLAAAVCALGIFNVIAGEYRETSLLVFAVAGLVAAMVMNRAGRWEWAARIAFTVMLMIAMLMVYEARDGFRSLAMLLFPATLLLSVLLLDRVSYLITSGIVLIAVSAMGMAERLGLTRAIPRVRSSTTYESIFFVDLSLLVFAIIGSRIARDAQNNVVELGVTIDRASQANFELRETTQALQESEQQLGSIYNTVRDIIFHLAVEAEGRFRFVSVNAAFLRVTGLSREMVVGKMVDEVIPSPSLEMVLGKYRQAIQENAAVLWEETSDYPTGRLTGEVSVVPVFDHKGICTHLVGSVHDITDRKQAEGERVRLWTQLAQSQKMESIGRLAGGLAHDFNNLMSIILMNADSAFEELQSGESPAESLAMIRETADRAVELGRQLMTFSSTQVVKLETVDLNSVVAGCQKLVKRLIGEDVKVIFKPGSGLGPVRADRGQLGQVIMNLAVNSRDAMPEGGTWTIETAAVASDESSTPLSPDAKPGAYVMLAIRDTGVGMDQETQARAFEPFFTTKGAGKGTGLGLPLVYGIVKQSGGFITVTSQPGHGTEFRIYLPAVLETSEPIPGTDERPIQLGAETILLVEDEALLRQKAREVLEKAGYRVLVAQDGNEGLALAMEEAHSIHLLLTDVVMPEMSGPRLSEHLRSLRPETKVLFMSGYPNASGVSLDLQSQPNFIEKPFTKEGLLRRVREVLEGEI